MKINGLITIRKAAAEAAADRPSSLPTRNQKSDLASSFDSIPLPAELNLSHLVSIASESAVVLKQ